MHERVMYRIRSRIIYRGFGVDDERNGDAWCITWACSWTRTYVRSFNKSKPAAAAAAPLNDSHSDLNFTAESFSGNEVGTVMFLSLPFH